MQTLKNQKRTPDHRKPASCGAPRSKFVRQPKKGGPAAAPPISNGVLALALSPIKVPKVRQLLGDPIRGYEKLYTDLYPAYRHFINLAGDIPKEITNDEYAAGTMLNEICNYFSNEVEVDVFTRENSVTDFEHRFILRQKLDIPQTYNIFFYRPLARTLWKNGKRKYYHLLHQIFRTMNQKLKISLWSDIQDYPIEWMMEREDDDEKELRANQRMIEEYDSGNAAKAESRILNYGCLTVEDVAYIRENLDLDHPISKMAIDAFNLAEACNDVNLGINKYLDVLDDEFQGLRFDCQWQIYYANDWLFDMYEEFVNNDANEGIQDPTVMITLNADMESFPDFDDPFPLLASKFFDTYGDIETQLNDYLKIKRCIK